MFGTVESWGGYFDPLHDGPLKHADKAALRAHDPTLLVHNDAAILLELSLGHSTSVIPGAANRREEPAGGAANLRRKDEWFVMHDGRLVRTTMKHGLRDPAWPGADVPAGRRVYRQPQPPPRSVGRRLARALGWVTLGLAVVVSGLAGGLYLWLHQSLAAIEAHSPAVIVAQRHLAARLPGQPTIALLVGDNQRMGLERSAGGRSDTLMLARADPNTKTISLLSLPRDLRVPVWCPHSPETMGVTRIDYAFAYCGPAGSLETVQKLTGLRINYLITVDFHGFKEIVNDLGGIWLDVDRRYYNHNVGTASTDYSNINLQPGYQLLSGGSALQFVRFRHTDSDFYRQARQQEFLRALKDQLAQHLDPLKLPAIVSAITHNVEVGACRSCISDSTVVGYALLALELPRGHLLQNYVAGTSNINVGGADELQPSPDSIPQAVYQFTHPPIHAKPKPSVTPAPPPDKTTITVLNGNGVPGQAANTTARLHERGYIVQPPPGQQPANAPTLVPRSHVYFDPTAADAGAAATALAHLIGGATITRLPANSPLRPLDPGSTLVLVLGRTFTGTLTPPAAARTPAISAPLVPEALATLRHDNQTGRALLAPFLRRTPFPLETPTVLDASSAADTLPGDQPVRLYTITTGHKAIRLVFRTGGGAYWGIEETDWPDPPALASPSQQRTIHRRDYRLYYSSGHLHMVVLTQGKTNYWVINTLLDTLPNHTMLATAEGLQPLDR